APCTLRAGVVESARSGRSFCRFPISIRGSSRECASGERLFTDEPGLVREIPVSAGRRISASSVPTRVDALSASRVKHLLGYVKACSKGDRSLGEARNPGGDQSRSGTLLPRGECRIAAGHSFASGLSGRFERRLERQRFGPHLPGKSKKARGAAFAWGQPHSGSAKEQARPCSFDGT